MKSSKLFRILALVLVLALTVFSPLTAGAAHVVGDINGDGKITVFDAQLLLEAAEGLRTVTNASGATVQSVLDFVLGNTTVDAGDLDSDGVTEIYTAEGLQLLHEKKTGSFILMNDIDLAGAAWTPVSSFSGSFDGNGHTISNLVITSTTLTKLGFFSETTADAVVTDLALRDVTLNASPKSQFMGLVAGVNNGTIDGCTVTGSIHDTRTATASGGKIYVGGLVGSATSGSVTGGTTVTAADDLEKSSVSGLCGDIGLFVQKESSSVITEGLYGRLLGSASVTGLWCDRSNSSSQLSETIQARQDKVVDYMTAMASVKWTPSETLTYTATNGTDQTYTKGVTYTGLPYNGHNGSLERFLSVMESQDANGVYTAQTGLGSGGWKSTAVVQNYVRVYQLANTTAGTVEGRVTKTTTVPSEVFTYDTAHNTLVYTKDGAAYYLGSDDTNTYFRVSEGSVSQNPAHLYTTNSSGAAVMVTNPKTDTAYKLGITAEDGEILFFNGKTASVDGTTCLATTAEVSDAEVINAVDVYLKSVDGGYHLCFDTEGAWSETGFYLTMGNDCSGAVNWAWMQISNVLAADVPSHGTPYKGGVYVVTTNYMIPNDTNRESKGIYPVGSWQASTIKNGKWVSAEFDTSKAAYQCTDQTYSVEVLNSNGRDVILEAYAQTHKADAVVCYTEQWSTRVANGGHSRLVAADPMVIRNADNSIDAEKSYMLQTEQGVGFSATSTTHWNIEKVYTFKALLDDPADSGSTAYHRTYLPITIRALREDAIRETYLIQNPGGSIVSPTEGGIYTYHRINSVTVTVTDADGKVYYDQEAFTGIGTNYNTYRGRNNDVKMADLHSDTFYAAAAENGMVEGQTYYFTVEVLLSTGETKTMVNNGAFTYTAPTAE